MQKWLTPDCCSFNWKISMVFKNLSLKQYLKKQTTKRNKQKNSKHMKLNKGKIIYNRNQSWISMIVSLPPIIKGS